MASSICCGQIQCTWTKYWSLAASKCISINKHTALCSIFLWCMNWLCLCCTVRSCTAAEAHACPGRQLWQSCLPLQSLQWSPHKNQQASKSKSDVYPFALSLGVADSKPCFLILANWPKKLRNQLQPPCSPKPHPWCQGCPPGWRLSLRSDLLYHNNLQNKKTMTWNEPGLANSDNLISLDPNVLRSQETMSFLASFASHVKSRAYSGPWNKGLFQRTSPFLSNVAIIELL